jgi:beta-N-acetylhexosaminidase
VTRRLYLAIAIGCIALGLVVRAPTLGLPRELAKYGGSILWAMMVYFGLRALVSHWSIWVAALLAAGLVALGEATQLVSFPWFDALRATTLGHLIFGRTFAIEDIVAYWIGILIAAGAEWMFARFAHERKPRR